MHHKIDNYYTCPSSVRAQSQRLHFVQKRKYRDDSPAFLLDGVILQPYTQVSFWGNSIGSGSFSQEHSAKVQAFVKEMQKVPHLSSYTLLSPDQMLKNNALYMYKFYQDAAPKIPLEKVSKAINDETFEIINQGANMIYNSLIISCESMGVVTKPGMQKFIRLLDEKESVTKKLSFQEVFLEAKNFVRSRDINKLAELLPDTLKLENTRHRNEILQDIIAIHLTKGYISTKILRHEQDRILHFTPQDNIKRDIQTIKKLLSRRKDQKKIKFNMNMERAFEDFQKALQGKKDGTMSDADLYTSMLRFTNKIAQFLVVQEYFDRLDSTLAKVDHDSKSIKEQMNDDELYKFTNDIIELVSVASKRKINMAAVLEFQRKKMLIRLEDYYNFQSTKESRNRTRMVEKILESTILLENQDSLN